MTEMSKINSLRVKEYSNIVRVNGLESITNVSAGANIFIYQTKIIINEKEIDLILLSKNTMLHL